MPKTLPWLQSSGQILAGHLGKCSILMRFQEIPIILRPVNEFARTQANSKNHVLKEKNIDDCKPWFVQKQKRVWFIELPKACRPPSSFEETWNLERQLRGRHPKALPYSECILFLGIPCFFLPLLPIVQASSLQITQTTIIHHHILHQTCIQHNF